MENGEKVSVENDKSNGDLQMKPNLIKFINPEVPDFETKINEISVPVPADTPWSDISEYCENQRINFAENMRGLCSKTEF